MPHAPKPSARLRVRLVSGDVELAKALSTSLARRDADVVAHTAPVDALSTDIVLVDAGPPLPDAAAMRKLRAEYGSAVMIVLAREVDADARELAATVDAVGFLKKGEAVADLARLVVELAAITQIPRY